MSPGSRSAVVIDTGVFAAPVTAPGSCRSCGSSAHQLEAVTERGPGLVTASVIDPFGNGLGITYSHHCLYILRKRGGAH